MKQEPIFSNLQVVRAARRRRRRRGWNWPRIGAFFFIVLVLTWMLCSCERTQQWTHEGEVELVSPWLSGSAMGLLVASVVALVWLVVRSVQKQGEIDAEAYARVREGERWARDLPLQNTSTYSDEEPETVVVSEDDLRRAARTEQAGSLSHVPEMSLEQMFGACPWPETVWPMTMEEYVKAVPDAALRTAISGYLMRDGWNVAKKVVELKLKEVGV